MSVSPKFRIALPAILTILLTTSVALGADPGAAYPPTSEVSDQKAGSLLVYNVYTSGATNGNAQNTRINVTNTSTSAGTNVHLFFVADSCGIADAFVCLTPSQTSTILASDIDPGVTGYIVAVAVDGNGCPAGFNSLIGDEYVKFASGHAANLGAEAFSALFTGPLPGCDANSTTADINFNGAVGAGYNRAPRVLAGSMVPSRADGNDTLIIINRVGGNLAIGSSTVGTLFGLFYNDSENAVSFSITGGCQLRSSLSNTFPRLTPRFETFIPAGRTGWFKIFSQSDIGILGAMLNLNANVNTTSGAFGGGHNLHKLTLTAAATFTIPVFPSGC